MAANLQLLPAVGLGGACHLATLLCTLAVSSPCEYTRRVLVFPTVAVIAAAAAARFGRYRRRDRHRRRDVSYVYTQPPPEP